MSQAIATATARAVNCGVAPSLVEFKYYESPGCGENFAAANDVFVFFSNRLGCLGSIAVSIVGTALLIMLMRSCS
jgi:hypothetical protein